MRTSQIAALSSLVLGTLSHPFHDSHALESDHEALQRRQLSSELSSRLDNFRPQQRSRYVAEDGEEISVQRTSAPASTDPIEAATNHLRSVHPEAEFRRVNDNHVSSNGIAHVYFKQTLNGLDIDDADFNVNVRA